MPQTALEQGAGSLMQALLGGGRTERNAQLQQQMAYDQADGARADLDRKITEAHLKRDQRNAQQGYAKNFIATGMQPDMANMLANAAIGGLASNLQDAQKYDMIHRAEAAATASGNYTPENAILMAAQGKPLPTAEIDNGYVATGRYGDAPAFDPTSATEAKIAADNALVAQRQASARQHDARSAGGTTGAHNGDVVRDVGPGGQPVYHRKGDAYDDASTVLKDAVANGADPMGYSVDSVVRAMQGGHAATILPPAGPGQMRLITPDAVENVPMTGPTSAANAIVHAATAAAPPAPKAAPPPAAVAFLRAHPGQAAAFEAKYGVPAAMFLR